MYDFADLRSCEPPKFVPNEKSLMWYITNNSELSKFKRIIDRANLFPTLSNIQGNCTLFIPTNAYLENYNEDFFSRLDVGSARQIVNCTVIDRFIDKDIITALPVGYYTTRNKQNRMYVTNISGQTELNDRARIVQYNICLNNGMIHIIDNLLIPTECHYLN